MTQTQEQRDLMFRVRWQIVIDQAEFDMSDWVDSTRRDLVIFEKSNKDNPSPAAYSWFQIQAPDADTANALSTQTCNTVRCVAGWTVALAAPTPEKADEESELLTAMDEVRTGQWEPQSVEAWVARGAELLGLRFDTALELFIPNYRGQSVLDTLKALDYLLEHGDFPRLRDTHKPDQIPRSWERDWDVDAIKALFNGRENAADERDYEMVVGGVL